MSKKDKTNDAEPEKLKGKEYMKELRKLQAELSHLQEWVKHKGLRAIIVFEGRGRRSRVWLEAVVAARNLAGDKLGDLLRMATRSKKTLSLLQAYESRNVTFVDPDGGWPIVWAKAKGSHVWDLEGRKYLDLTAAFGVAAAGHANPAVVRAGQKQMATLLHAMGDVHPHPLKAELARELSQVTFGRWGRAVSASGIRHPASGKTIFCNSGFEAVEAALKTALLATGKSRVVAFEGGYHGLGYGALSTTHRGHFRDPFRRQLREFADFVPFPGCGCVVGRASSPGQNGFRHAQTDAELNSANWPGEDARPTKEYPPLPRIEAALVKLLKRGDVGAVLVEPMQARGGIRIPPPEFLQILRRRCDEFRALLIVDEIYTGFGRTGRMFACEHSGVVPDLICLGKALTGGFPLSACVGRADLMDRAWPASNGEAIHTSTFLGHPVGCAMALAQLTELKRLKLSERSAKLGRLLLGELQAIRSDTLQLHVRGAGLMAGLEVRRRDGSPATAESLQTIKRLLHDGFIFLPEGEHANVIGFTPPLTISERDLRRSVNALANALRTVDT